MKLKAVLLYVLLFVTSASAQTNSNNFELSVSGSFGALKSTLESKSNTYSYTSEGSLSYYAIANCRLGYFLNKNFSIEPELQLFILESIEPGYFVNANALYHFESDSSKVIPFLLGGYGIGNRIPMFSTIVYSPTIKPVSINQFNFGTGLKIFLSEDFAIRTEYRFQLLKFTEESKGAIYSYQHKYTYYMHNVFVGVSYFF